MGNLPLIYLGAIHLSSFRDLQQTKKRMGMIYLTFINYGHRSLKFLAELHLSITNIRNVMICVYIL